MMDNPLITGGLAHIGVSSDQVDFGLAISKDKPGNQMKSNVPKTVQKEAAQGRGPGGRRPAEEPSGRKNGGNFGVQN